MGIPGGLGRYGVAPLLRGVTEGTRTIVASTRVGGVASTVVDGVTVLSQPAPGPLRAVLMFRVGQADETLPTRGVTHLVEHLALTGTNKGPHAFNGYTGDVLTSFVVAGEPGEVTAHLAAVCEALRRLPVDRLEHERSILRTEAAGSGGAFAKSLSAWRWGPQGYGLLGYEEMGVPGICAEQAQQWADQWFTPSQAVLWLSGPLPEGLRLPLPPGGRPPCPTPSTVSIEKLPGCYSLADRGVAFSYLAPRQTEAVGFLFVLQRRLMTRLRDELGVSYGVQVALDRISAQQSLHTLMADCMPENAHVVQDGVVDVLQRMRTHPVTEQEIADFRGSAAMAAQDEGAKGLAHADYVARQLLLGGETLTVEAIEAEQRAVTAQGVSELADNVLATLLLAVPDHTRVPVTVALPCPVWSEHRVDGRSYQPSGARKSSPAERLTVGADGVTAHFSTGLVTVAFANCAGMLRSDDGTRSLIGFDGLHVVCDPADWRDGSSLPELLDKAVPAELWMKSTSTPGEAGPISPAARPSRWRRALRGVGIGLSVAAVLNVTRALTGLAGGEPEPEPTLPPLSDTLAAPSVQSIADGQCLQYTTGLEFGLVDPVGCNNVHVAEVIANLGPTTSPLPAAARECRAAAGSTLTPEALHSVTVTAIIVSKGFGPELFCLAQVPVGRSLRAALPRR